MKGAVAKLITVFIFIQDNFYSSLITDHILGEKAMIWIDYLICLCYIIY